MNPTLSTAIDVATVLAAVIVERLRRGVPYKEYFEWLAREAELYRQRHYPDAEPRVVRQRQEDQF
jgi:hypothetical protein